MAQDNFENLLQKMSEYLESEISKDPTASEEFQHKRLMNDLHRLASQSLSESKYQKDQLESVQLLKDIVEKGTNARDDKYVIKARLNNVLKTMAGVKKYNLDSLKAVTETGMKVMRQDYLEQQNKKPAADRLAEQNLVKAKIDSMAGNNIELNSYIENLSNADSELSQYEYYMAKAVLKNAGNSPALNKLEEIKTRQNTLEPWKKSDDYKELDQKLGQIENAKRDASGYVITQDESGENKVIDPQSIVNDFAKSGYSIEDPKQRDAVAQDLKNKEREQFMQGLSSQEDERDYKDRLAEQVTFDVDDSQEAVKE
ncbi:MAG: hypothetical protein LKJ37_00950 [Ligilactobacillus acidipiscis]|jgi:hypothetical protein|nr:hypothetical protein [Ligilactobacillus acidipiscis]MCI1953538.1 hypothetical protein [Ligilactobacillus acidipiscis]